MGSSQRRFSKFVADRIEEVDEGTFRAVLCGSDVEEVLKRCGHFLNKSIGKKPKVLVEK